MMSVLGYGWKLKESYANQWLSVWETRGFINGYQYGGPGVETITEQCRHQLCSSGLWSTACNQVL
jgi:hypothetical protein